MPVTQKLSPEDAHLGPDRVGYDRHTRRHASVTEMAGRLQQAGLIRYGHGVIQILDRPALEAASSECYGVIKQEYDRLLGPRGLRGTGPPHERLRCAVDGILRMRP